MDSDEKVDAAGGSALGIAGLTDAFEVARGGFATVYRARQPLLDRIIAVKLIHATVIDPLGGERFLREVKATGRLSQHPNVAPVYDVGTTASGQPYLIMPFYARGSLGKLVEREGRARRAHGRAHRADPRRHLGVRAPARRPPPRHQARQRPHERRR